MLFGSYIELIYSVMFSVSILNQLFNPQSNHSVACVLAVWLIPLSSSHGYVCLLIVCPAYYALFPLSPAACRGGSEWMQHVDHGRDD